MFSLHLIFGSLEKQRAVVIAKLFGKGTVRL
jgi:hypothetical protein